jgi:hypothetical protein
LESEIIWRSWIIIYFSMKEFYLICIFSHYLYFCKANIDYYLLYPYRLRIITYESWTYVYSETSVNNPIVLIFFALEKIHNIQKPLHIVGLYTSKNIFSLHMNKYIIEWLIRSVYQVNLLKLYVNAEEIPKGSSIA